MFNFGPSSQLAQRFTGANAMTPNPPQPRGIRNAVNRIQQKPVGPMGPMGSSIMPQNPMANPIDTGSGIGVSRFSPVFDALKKPVDGWENNGGIGSQLNGPFDIPRKPVDGALTPNAGNNPMQGGLMNRYARLASSMGR